MAEALDDGDIEVNEDSLVWTSEESCFTLVIQSSVTAAIQRYRLGLL